MSPSRNSTGLALTAIAGVTGALLFSVLPAQARPGDGPGSVQGSVVIDLPTTITSGIAFTASATVLASTPPATTTPATTPTTPLFQARVDSICGNPTPVVTTTSTGAFAVFTLTCPADLRGGATLTVTFDIGGRQSLTGRATLIPTTRAAFFDQTTLYSIDGSGNNLANSAWGAAGSALTRTAPNAYGDHISTAAGASRPSARLISNTLSAQAASILNDREMSDFAYVWGQFLDHDINLTSTGSEKLPVLVPVSDPSFDPAGTGMMTIPFSRSTFASGTGSSVTNPRQQTGLVTTFVDGSQIYGSDATRANALRSFTGGKLKTSDGNMLPFNTAGLANANDSHLVADSRLYLAGDVRANENPDLASLQTVWMREHNRVATRLQGSNPGWTDEQIYQAARQYVIAELQAITYNEFLPALLGASALAPYSGYDSSVDPSIANEFSTGAFRYGHSLLDGELPRLNNDGTPTAAGPITLQSAFFNTTVFNPSLPNHEGDIDPFLKAAATGNAQEVDLKVVDDVRNFLFGPPGAGGLDLASLNIQRGRDHGLADYNTVRAAYGLPRVRSFAQITSDTSVQAKLQSLYGTVDNIDLWVGGLAENHAPGASVGPLFQKIIVDQFARIRAADRHWYESIFTGDELTRLRSTHLSEVIARNTSLTTLQRNVFFSRGGAGS